MAYLKNILIAAQFLSPMWLMRVAATIDGNSHSRSRGQTGNVQLVSSLVGTMTVLKCFSPSNSSAIWSKNTTSITHESKFDQIMIDSFAMDGSASRFSLDRSVDGWQNLIINNTVVGDAGLYKCHEDGGLGGKSYIKLSVRVAATEKLSQFVVLGGTAQIDCPLATVWWEFQSYTDHRSSLIFNGFDKVDTSRVDNFIVNSSRDDNSRVISTMSLFDVQLKYAGTFWCTNPGDDTRKLVEHELGILVTRPQCSVNLTELGVVDEFQTIIVQCNVTYLGKWIPTFHCLPEIHTISLSHNPGYNVSDAEVLVVTYIHPVNVTRTLNNTSLTCSMAYVLEESMADATPPSSDFNWKTVPLSVTYGPVITKLEVRNSTVICLTDGNPRPTTTWFVRPENTTVSYYSTMNVCDLQKTQQWMREPHFDTDKFELDLVCTASRNGRVVYESSKFKLLFKHLDTWCTDNTRPMETTAILPTENQVCPECGGDFPTPIESESTLSSTAFPHSQENNNFIIIGASTVLVVVILVVSCGVLICICCLKRRQRKNASKQQVNLHMRTKSKRLLTMTRQNQCSGIYDEIYDTPNTGNGTESTYPYDYIRGETNLPTQTYDEIPDNDTSNRQSYQNLNTETKEEVSFNNSEIVAGAPLKPVGDENVYLVPCVELQANCSPLLATRKSDENMSEISTVDMANLATRVDSQLTDSQLGRVDQPGYHQLNHMSRLANPPTTSVNYTVLRRKNSLDRSTQLASDKYLSLLTEEDDGNTSVEVTKGTNLTENKCLPSWLIEQSHGNIAEPDSRQVHRQLDTTTGALPSELAGVDERNYQGLDSWTRNVVHTDTAEK